MKSVHRSSLWIIKSKVCCNFNTQVKKKLPVNFWPMTSEVIMVLASNSKTHFNLYDCKCVDRVYVLLYCYNKRFSCVAAPHFSFVLALFD